MPRWFVLISLLLNALFAPQVSSLCACPFPQSPPPATETCPCCAAGECDCGIAPSSPSSLPSKEPLALTRAAEHPPATLDSHPRLALTPSGLSQTRSFAHPTSRPIRASASEHRALLCRWQT